MCSGGGAVECCEDCFEWFGVENVFGSESTFAGDTDTVSDIGESLCGVSVWIDADDESFFLGVVEDAPIEVESMWIGVDLDDDVVCDGGVDDFIDIEGVGFAAEKQASGDMADHGCRRVLDGFDDAFSHGFFGEVKLAVDRSDNKVELVEDVLWVVEATICQDIGFDAFEDLEIVPFCVELVNFFVLAKDFGDLESSGIVSSAAMVGDAEVLHAHFACGFAHFFE